MCGVTLINEMPGSRPASTALPFDDDPAAAAAITHGHPVGREGRLHARQRFDALDDVIDSPRLGFVCLVRCTRKVEAHRHQRRRIESDGRRLEVQEAADEERRADEQHERKRDLGDDQRVAEAGARPAGAAAAALLQAALKVAAHRLQRRRQPEDDAGQERDDDGVGEGTGRSGSSG